MISPDSSDQDSMKYAIFGGEGISTEDKLSQYKGVVSWSYLAPHYKNEALFFVDSSLDLEVVGAAFTGNEVERVDAWIKAGDLVKIAELHARQWEGTGIEFEALVVSPFVLCRPL